MNWYEEFYGTVDAMNADLLQLRCTPDTTVRFANHERAEGWDAVRATLERSWSTFAGMHHRILEVVEDGDRAVIEAIVDYTRHDGGVVSVPAATAIHRRGELVAAQRIYIDLTPLFAEAPPAPMGTAKLDRRPDLGAGVRATVQRTRDA